MRPAPFWSPFLIAAMLLVSVPPASFADYTVTCGSENNRYTHCDLSEHGFVTLTRQLSSARCDKGRTWDFDRRGIWVDDGCRAEFRVETYDDYRSGSSASSAPAYQTVTCESRNGSYRRCDMDTRDYVTLTRQLSGTQCLQGQNWDYDRRGIWVDKGCRAEFRVGSYGDSSFGSTASSTPSYQSVTCESQGGSYRRCDMDTRGHVSLTRQLSSTRCLQGQTWDFDSRGIWVDKGCRAEFRVGSYSSGSQGGGSDNDAAVAAGVVLGAAVLGALIHNQDHQDKHKYNDENYYGRGHTSYVPDWMVGTFRGHNPLYGKDVVMTISADGRVTADAEGETIRGYVNDERLHVGSFVFDIDRTREGFVTAQEGDRHNEVYYRRVR